MKRTMKFHEAYRPEFLAENAEGKSWEIVVIQPGWSLNGKYYPPDVLRAAAPLFEGLKVYAYRFGKPLRDEFDHLPLAVELQKPEGFAENLVGYFENARYGTFQRRDGGQGEGVLTRFHVLEGAEWLRKNLRDAWMHGRPEILGFSINAEGVAHDAVIAGKTGKRVDAINRIVSTEVVSEPAAGGRVIRLVASAKEAGEMDKELKELLVLVEAKFPRWTEGFTGAGENEGLDEYLLRLFEANAERAQAELQGVPAEDKELLAEVARGVKSLNTVIDLIRQGKVKEAMALLQNWVSVYPAAEKGTPASRAQGFYSFPYAAPKGGYPGPGALRPYGAAPPAGAAESKKEEEVKAMDDKAIKDKEKELAARESLLRIRERLAASNLPELARARVEKLLLAEGAGEVTDEAIDQAVNEERQYLAKISESGKPKGLGGAHETPPARVTSEEQDKVTKAFDGFFAGQDVDGVRAFTSIQEAFHIVNRPIGYHTPLEIAEMIFESIAVAFPRSPSREMPRHLAQLREGGMRHAPVSARFREAIQTTTFPVAFGDAMWRRLQKVYRDDPLNDWRQIVSSIENLKDLTNKFKLPRIGGFGVLPTVLEKGPYQELSPEPTEKSEEITPAKKGGLAKLTLETILADSIGVIRRIPTALGRAAARTVHELVWDEIDKNPLMVDSVALFNAAHGNYSTDPLAYAAVTNAIQRLRDQTEQDSLKKLGLNPAFLIVSTTKENEAVEITDSSVKVSTSEDSTVRSFVNKLGVKTFATLGLGRFAPNAKFYWYIAASPQDAETIVVGFLGGRDQPDIYVQSPVDTPTAGAAFDADALTFKIRLGVGVKVADWRWIQGNLATS